MHTCICNKCNLAYLKGRSDTADLSHKRINFYSIAYYQLKKKKSIDLNIAQKSKLLGQMELPSMVREGAGGTQNLRKGCILPSHQLVDSC